jgi:DNA-binding MarR family transcriptional regulator
MSTEAPHPSPNDEGRPDNWSMGRLLSTAARAMENAWSDALETLGLTHAGLIVLHLLDRGVTSQADLARFAHVEAQTMSRTVDRLEREGFVARAPDPGDRRRHILAMTDAGRHVWQRTLGLERTVFPDVDDPEALRSALLQIMRELDAPER